MDFALFIALNAVLLIRPEELIPSIAGLRLYLIVISLCVLTSLRSVLAQLSPANLVRRPITVCVLGLLGALALSQLVRGQVGIVLEIVPGFAKVVLYYLLLLAIIDTPGRLRAFVGCLVFFVVVLATAALLQYHGFIDVEALRVLDRIEYDAESGEVITYSQLRGTGIYNDPNDLCLILTTGVICCLARCANSSGLLARAIWLAPIGLFVYATLLTKSRGGLLGLMAAVATLLIGRYGWKRSLPLVVLTVPAMILAAGGRQANINLSGNDTAQTRLQLWAEGLNLLLTRNPLTGIGVGEFDEEFGHVAHNSFVHAYVEMGLFGGTLFLGAFYLAIWGILRLRRAGQPLPGRLRLLQPYMIALVVGYAAGLYSLSRNFVVPTYMILGVAAVYLQMAMPETPPWFHFDSGMRKRLALFGVGGLLFLKCFTQVFVQFS